MPILYKTMIKNYLKIFILSIFLFISILILMRVQEIAKFATFSSSLSKVFLFTVYQFPLILPMAIPISCLISSVILVHRLSATHEMTSLRTCGMSIKEIFFPLTALSILLSIFNFFMVFELTPHTKQLSKNLIYQVTTSNPLALLQTKKVSKLQDAYIKMKVKKSSLKAKDLIFAFCHPKTHRIELLLAEELNVETLGVVQGKNVDFIGYIPTSEEDKAHLYIEHENFVLSPGGSLASFLSEHETKKSSDQKLSFKPLISKFFIPSISLKEKKETFFEILRRLYLSIGPFVLNQVGLIWAIDIGRRPSRIYKVILTFLSISYFAIYLASKPLKHSAFIALILFSLFLYGLYALTKRHERLIEQGIEKCI